MYLTGHLEVQELLQVPLISKFSGINLVALIVRLDKVLGNGAGLPQGQTIVRIDDGGQSAVWVYFQVLLVFRVGNVNLRVVSECSPPTPV